MKLIVLAVVLCILAGCQSEETWYVEKIGIVDSIEYVEAPWNGTDKTIIRFNDESTIVLWDMRDVPSKNIIIEQNNYGERRIKEVNDDILHRNERP